MTKNIKHVETTFYEPYKDGEIKGIYTPQLRFVYDGDNQTIPLNIGLMLVFSGEGIGFGFDFKFQIRIRSLYKIERMVPLNDIHELHYEVRDKMVDFLRNSIDTSFFKDDQMPVIDSDFINGQIRDANLFDHLIEGFNRN